MALPAENIRYTFADCLTWDENDHIEIINGDAYMMAPPTRVHQKVSGEIFRQLANYLDGKSAKSIRPPLQSGCSRRTETVRRTWIPW